MDLGREKKKERVVPLLDCACYDVDNIHMQVKQKDVNGLEILMYC